MYWNGLQKAQTSISSRCYGVLSNKKFMKTPIYNKETLQKCLEEEKKRLSIDLRQELMDSMPERLHKCLQAKRGHFS